MYMKSGFIWTTWLLACTLTACGGGGSGGGGSGGGGSSTTPSPTSPPVNSTDGSWLTFNPAAPTVTQYEGESATFSVKGTASRMFTQNFNVGVIDANGVITTQVSIQAESQMAYVFNMHTAATLAAGTHTTSLEVRVCEDSPLTCAKPFPGSPWHVPLTVQVQSKVQAAARLTLPVPDISLTAFPDEQLKFNIVADLNNELVSSNAHIGIVDPANLTIQAADQYTYSATNGRIVLNLQTALGPNSAVGKHSSNLELRICADDVRTCRLPVAGSPWIVPLTVNVTSSTNLTSLTAIDGLDTWSTFQGNAAHTAYVAASFNPAAFTRRWRLAADSSGTNNYGTTAIDNGKVFIVQAKNYTSELIALSEDTGGIVWKTDLRGVGYFGSPAASNGRVYVAGSWLSSIDQSTGKLVNEDELSLQSLNLKAPTVLGGNAYVINGYFGGLAKFSDTAGKFSWQTPMTVSEGWNPATDGTYVYTYSTPDNVFTALNAADGSRAYTIGPDFPYSTKFTALAVLLTDAKQAIVAAGPMMAFDLATRKLAWSVGSSYDGVAAYGNGTIYALANSGQTLEARAAASGSLLWSMPTGGYQYANLIVTKNLAFISSPTSTLAIDIATHKVVWTFARGGALAISQRGVLYIQSAGNGLDAINLR